MDVGSVYGSYYETAKSYMGLRKEEKQAGSAENGAQILQNMQTIADILQHPVANRSISDLEEGDADE